MSPGGLMNEEFYKTSFIFSVDGLLFLFIFFQLVKFLCLDVTRSNETSRQRFLPAELKWAGCIHISIYANQMFCFDIFLFRLKNSRGFPLYLQCEPHYFLFPLADIEQQTKGLTSDIIHWVCKKDYGGTKLRQSSINSLNLSQLGKWRQCLEPTTKCGTCTAYLPFCLHSLGNNNLYTLFWLMGDVTLHQAGIIWHHKLIIWLPHFVYLLHVWMIKIIIIIESCVYLCTWA
jgi:hypothetical protein